MTPEDEQKLREFNQQWDAQYSTDDTKPPIDGGGTGGTNLLDSVQNQPIVPNTAPYVPAAIPTTGDSCSQCGTMHPPIRPGETCPVAAEMKGQPVETAPAPAAAPVQPLTEGTIKTEVKNVENAPPRPEVAPPAPQPVAVNTETLSEPAALADNNIPPEIHINKYLASWGDTLVAHCKNNAVHDVKKLMRHITVEVTAFLEYYKGR